MTQSAFKRTKTGFVAIVALSSVSMLWLFWHYPIKTGIATLIVLAGFAILAALARSMDTELARTMDTDGIADSSQLTRR